MKDLLQKLPLRENTSFVCRTYRTPYFETPWHYHEEYEIAVITEGCGDVMVGDYLGNYEEGDVFFLGSNLPHWFRKRDQDSIGSAVVVQFRKSFLGPQFWNLPEMANLHRTLELSAKGLQLRGQLASTVATLAKQMESMEGYTYVRTLTDCLNEITENGKDCKVLSLTGMQKHTGNDDLIGRVFEYTFLNFHDDIKVEKLAKSLNMSVSSFTRFFKKNTKKTYIQFVKEVRVARACTLLAKSAKPISLICSESGYNNWANFSRQFREIKKMSPSDYRKKTAISATIV